MGQLVFQATAGGQVALVGPNPSTSFALNVPAVNGNLVTTGDTGTVTNTMLASSAYTAPGTIGSGTANTGAFTTLNVSTSITNASLTSGRVIYTTTGGLETASANLTFNGTTLTTANDASISGLTVGKGGGAVSGNAVFGLNAGASNTSGGITAFGNSAANANTTGGGISAFGDRALPVNTTGGANSAFGSLSLFSNTTGNYNSALGLGSLQNNTTASNNTAVGYQAGYSNSTGTQNIYIGNAAGYTNSTGSYNTYLGYNAGTVATGSNNTALGYLAGYALTTGANNGFFGFGSGQAITTGSKNTILGGYSGNQGGLDIRTASNYIVLSDGDGNPNLYCDNTKWVFGSSLLVLSVGSYNSTTANAANMYIASNGTFQRSTSALKYKQDVRDLESIDVNKFRPVRYKSKCADDDQNKDHFGVIADEVDQAGIKELVNYGAEGEVEGFQYERLTVVLLKAVQELKAEVDSLKQQLGK
jgi:hypothetical protein